ncbi:MAG TPA: XF1762 family protein [Aquabacterium sp.]|nr:XF1762 family protein [Aquabacterium sp.]
MSIELRPITRETAFEFIRAHHRHHDVPVGGLWWQSVHDDAGCLIGVSITGRPVARALDDGLTAEVTRLCTDGTGNACSMLYAAARRVAIDKGFRRGLTYILASESGASLKAAGWEFLWDVKGRSWDCPSRPRIDKHPTENKQAWGWGAWPQLTVSAQQSKGEAV